MWENIFDFIILLLMFIIIFYQYMLLKKMVKKYTILLSAYLSAFEYLVELIRKKDEKESEKKSGATFIG